MRDVTMGNRITETMKATAAGVAAPAAAKDFSDLGLGYEFVALVEARDRTSREIKDRAAALAGYDAAIMAQMGEHAKVKVGNLTVTQVPGGVTRRLDRTKLLKRLSAGDLEQCMSESPRRWYLRYDDETQERREVEAEA